MTPTRFSTVWRLAAVTLAILTVERKAANAATFDLSWHTVAGGGAAGGSGGGYGLSSTIGQPQATASGASGGGGYGLTGGFWDSTVPACTDFAAADLDQDCDVDLADLVLFEACASGPALPPPAGCATRDLDRDNDIDQTDFAVFQRCFAGADRVPDPACE